MQTDLNGPARCIIPFSGFFEWKKEGSSKRPFKIFLKDSPIMSMAGILTAWRAGTAEEKRSCSILTTSANDFMASIHRSHAGDPGFKTVLMNGWIRRFWSRIPLRRY